MLHEWSIHFLDRYSYYLLCVVRSLSVCVCVCVCVCVYVCVCVCSLLDRDKLFSGTSGTTRAVTEGAGGGSVCLLVDDPTFFPLYLSNG